jgi:two-component system, LytTR family, response regulator
MKFLIIEDEPRAAKRLKRLILEKYTTADILEILDSVESALLWLNDDNASKVELAFADIELADGTSFEIFQNFDVQFPVIFTTAYDEYALDAFKVHAIDYLLKPIKRDDLFAALDKFEKFGRTEKGNTDALQQLIASVEKPQRKNRFVIRVGRTIKIIGIERVAYFYTEDKITYLVDRNGRRFPMDQTLSEIMDMLEEHEFFRANRQFIVRIDAIGVIHATSKARLKIALTPPVNGDVVVSTERSAMFKKWLEG